MTRATLFAACLMLVAGCVQPADSDQARPPKPAADTAATTDRAWREIAAELATNFEAAADEAEQAEAVESDVVNTLLDANDKAIRGGLSPLDDILAEEFGQGRWETIQKPGKRKRDDPISVERDPKTRGKVFREIAAGFRKAAQ